MPAGPSSKPSAVEARCTRPVSSDSSSGSVKSRTACGVMLSATEASKGGIGRRSPGSLCPTCWTTSSISPKVVRASFS